MAQSIEVMFGNELSTGDTVEVSETLDNLNFVGYVDSFRGGYVVVLDQEDNAFCVEPKNVKIV